MMTGDVCFGGDTDIRFQSAKQYGRPINLRTFAEHVARESENKMIRRGAIHSKINRWGKLENVDNKFVELFNGLSNAWITSKI